MVLFKQIELSQCARTRKNEGAINSRATDALLLFSITQREWLLPMKCKFVQNASMPRLTQRSRMLKFALVLFLMGQAFSALHASEFGHAPHEHDGVQCTAIISNDEQEGLLTFASLAAPEWTPLSVAAPHAAKQAQQVASALNEAAGDRSALNLNLTPSFHP